MGSTEAMRCLLEGASEASAAELATLFRLFGLVDKAAPQRAHCVRCHASYDPTLNAADACTVPHPEFAETDYGRIKSSSDYNMTLSCCGITWRGGVESEPPSYNCISAPHTTSIDDVRKHHRTDEEIERHGELDRRGRILETCAQRAARRRRPTARWSLERLCLALRLSRSYFFARSRAAWRFISTTRPAHPWSGCRSLCTRASVSEAAALPV